jgi:hypothetical protein
MTSASTQIISMRGVNCMIRSVVEDPLKWTSQIRVKLTCSNHKADLLPKVRSNWLGTQAAKHEGQHC